MNGGYSIADFTGVAVTIGAATGSATVQNIDPVIVNKFRDLKKPVLVSNLEITAGGASIDVAGFAPHTVVGGVHTHTYDNVTITVAGDTQLTFKVE